MQSSVAASLFGYLQIPPSQAEGAQFLNRFIYCRQWLLRSANGLSAGEQSNANSWLNFLAASGEAPLTSTSYMPLPKWDNFNILYSIASGQIVDGEADVLNQREVRAMEGAHGEIQAGLESTMRLFEILLKRHELLLEAMERYDRLIADVENNLVLI